MGHLSILIKICKHYFLVAGNYFSARIEIQEVLILLEDRVGGAIWK